MVKEGMKVTMSVPVRASAAINQRSQHTRPLTAVFRLTGPDVGQLDPIQDSEGTVCNWREDARA